jgi:type II secretory pathway predicted ATPase ExeA
MWQQHWGLGRDPFDEAETPYVPLPSHDEAVFRLIYSIEQARRDVVFTASAGLGKTIVLRRALAEIRSPGRRVVLIETASDELRILGRLAAHLGQSVGRQADIPSRWQALERGVRIAVLQGLHVIVALDNWTIECETRALDDLQALAYDGSGQGARLTTVRVGREPWNGGPESRDDGALTIGLMHLTRSQVEDYLARKLSAVGCNDPIFTPRAVTRIHGLSRGVPRGLERLASLSLMAGAVKGLEVIPPDLVDGVAQECRLDGPKDKGWQ